MRLISATLRATVAVSALSSLGLAMILSTPGAIDTSLIRRDQLQEVIGVPDHDALVDITDVDMYGGHSGRPYYAEGSGVLSGSSVLTTPTDDLKGWYDIFFVGTTDAYDQWTQVGDRESFEDKSLPGEGWIKVTEDVLLIRHLIDVYCWEYPIMSESKANEDTALLIIIAISALACRQILSQTRWRTSVSESKQQTFSSYCSSPKITLLFNKAFKSGAPRGRIAINPKNTK